MPDNDLSIYFEWRNSLRISVNQFLMRNLQCIYVL